MNNKRCADIDCIVEFVARNTAQKYCSSECARRMKSLQSKCKARKPPKVDRTIRDADGNALSSEKVLDIIRGRLPARDYDVVRRILAGEEQKAIAADVGRSQPTISRVRHRLHLFIEDPNYFVRSPWMKTAAE
jgi:DNA-binding NarL/FixJ family response regulator